MSAPHRGQINDIRNIGQPFMGRGINILDYIDILSIYIQFFSFLGDRLAGK